LDFTPESVDKFLKADREGKLSTKDRKMITKMRAGVDYPQEDLVADLVSSLEPMYMKQLADAIATTKNPRHKAILQEEQDSLMGLLSAMQSTPVPVEPPPPTKSESFMNAISDILSKIWSTK
jgi:hypothetical protein